VYCDQRGQVSYWRGETNLIKHLQKGNKRVNKRWEKKRKPAAFSRERGGAVSALQKPRFYCSSAGCCRAGKTQQPLSREGAERKKSGPRGQSKEGGGAPASEENLHRNLQQSISTERGGIGAKKQYGAKIPGPSREPEPLSKLESSRRAGRLHRSALKGRECAPSERGKVVLD